MAARQVLLMRLLPQVSRGGSMLLALLVIVSAALPVTFTLATGALVGTVPAAIRSGFDSPPGRRLLAALVAIGVLFVVQEILAPIRSLVAADLGRKMNLFMRERAIRAAMHPIGIAHLEDPAMLDKVSQAREIGPGSTTPMAAVNGLVTLTTMRLSGIGSTLIVARFRPLLAAFLVSVWMYSRVQLRRDFLETISLIVGGTERLRRSNYLRQLALTPPAAKELRVFGLATWLGDTFGIAWYRAMEEVWRERKESRARIAVISLSTAAVYLGAFLYLTRAAINNDITLGQLTVLISSMFAVSALAAMGNADYELEYGTSALASVPALEELVEDERLLVRGTRPAGGLPAREIRFDQVTFSYPSSDRVVFDALDLTIPAGRSLAIVGENGAGKTTLVKLLARLYEPTSGQITVDGVPLAEINPREWQRRIGAIFQDFVKYPLPANVNIAAGAIDNLDDADAIDRAIRLAGAGSVVAKLPNGSDTTLSRLYTDGVDLSGGEWQRIALARALFAVDAGAGVLILDEPTANLDVRAEADIYDRFLELTAGLTTILISHRFSTVRRAEHIVVLEHGRVIERGSHEELVALGGRYAAMFALQAARFADGPTAEPLDA